MMKKILFLMVICVATSLTSILPASAQNSDQTDEYKTLLKKIMTLSGSSASSEAIMSQLMASMKNVSNATTYVKNKKKTLYIKVRPYQTINKKNVYGRWSYLQL